MIILSNVGWKSGLREWILQRFTAFYMTIYFIFIFVFIMSYGFSFKSLSLLFYSFYFKLFTILLVFNLVLHCSIGMSIIINDYIKNTTFRIILDFLINSVLLMYIFFIMQILWSLK